LSVAFVNFRRFSMSLNRTALSCIFLTVAVCGVFALTEAPKYKVAFVGSKKTELASRYPLRTRTSSFFERSKASYSRPSRSFTYRVR
jgi:hypothetical protein